MFSLSHFFDRFVPRLQECRRRGRCENKLHLWIYILVFLFSVSYTTLIMSWQSSNSEVNRAKNSCNAEQPPSSKIYNVYKIVYKEKQDTLVTITKLKVSPGTCLATYGDSCSICSSKLFRVIKGASWRRLFFSKGKGEPIWHTAKPYLHFRETSSTIFISLYSYRHDASLYGYLVTYPCL